MNIYIKIKTILKGLITIDSYKIYFYILIKLSKDWISIKEIKELKLFRYIIH